ncbi:hypothetical protein MMC30_002916 [Trapelia coarctata]|nr:hypothetical protein [Trapelia coarctata]
MPDALAPSSPVLETRFFFFDLRITKTMPASRANTARVAPTPTPTPAPVLRPDEGCAVLDAVVPVPAELVEGDDVEAEDAGDVARVGIAEEAINDVANSRSAGGAWKV